MMNNKTNIFTLGDVRVIPAHNELSAFGQTRRLQPRAMEVLCYLAQHHERVIANEELTEQVWRGRVVTHGSVQKSINLLRKAFAELIGEHEVIAHYSKRGYQLQIEPLFHPSADEPSLTAAASPDADSRRWIRAALSAVLVLVLLTLGYFYSNRHILFIDKSHNTDFTQLHIYISDADHVRGAEPHPDNRHLAYISDTGAADGTFGSDLIIRDQDNNDWLLASSSGSWQMLDWSASGEHLVAVELIDGSDTVRSSGSGSRTAQLYDIHVFMLDVNEHRVQEKHRLSQWQGRINSVSWWDEDTLELVARQGDTLFNQRYRYSLSSQRLETVRALDFISNPLLSRNYNRQTALASLYNGTTRIDFLAADQTRFASTQLDYRAQDISWLPDGSGVLVYADDESALTLVYRDGETRELILPRQRDSQLSVPRYRADNQSILFTRVRPKTDLWQQRIDNTHQQLVDASDWHYAASLSPDGQSLAYISVRDNQVQLHVWENNQQRLMTPFDTQAHISDLIWSSDNQHLVFKMAGTLYIYSLADASTRVLMGGAHDLTPLAINRATQQLLVLRQSGEVNNLWRIGYNSGEEKQLTFGSIGSVIAQGDDSYFQYTGQRGLWAWRQRSNSLVLVNHHLERHSRILSVSDKGVYTITGDDCRESDIFYLAFDQSNKEIFLPRDNVFVMTQAMHPQYGALYSHCQLAPSDIVELTAP